MLAVGVLGSFLVNPLGENKTFGWSLGSKNFRKIVSSYPEYLQRFPEENLSVGVNFTYSEHETIGPNGFIVPEWI